jgi:D-alanyl-D-alanine carboxypeptidase/D-alanyl-D-alanine-endopeptidase (penicillin-binding protein 4)
LSSFGVATRRLAGTGAVVALAVLAGAPRAMAAPPGAFGLLADSLDFLSRDAMSQAEVSVLVYSLDRGDTLAALHPATRLIPGSNLKLFTTGAYLRASGPVRGSANASANASAESRPETRVYAYGKAKVDRKISGVRLEGDLILQGCGMPDVYQLLRPGSRGLIDSLAFLLQAGGLRAFTGTLWVDTSVFAPEPYAPGWAFDDLVYSYAAPVGALMANGDAASVIATSDGRGVALSLDPPETPLAVRGDVAVGNPGEPGHLSVDRALGSRVVEVSGTVPRGGITKRQVAVPEADSAAGLVLLGAMQRAGIRVKGVVRMLPSGGTPVAKVPAIPGPFDRPPEGGWTRVARDRAALVTVLPTPPPGEVVGIVNAMSLNIEAEALLRQLDPATPKTRVGGLARLRAMARDAGVDSLDLSLVDGSGLSPMDLVTTRAIVTWLASIAADSTLGPMFRDGLARPGGVGTLKRRFATIQGDSVLQAKTGTLTNVSALSGYLTTGEGERLAFAMLSNGNFGSVDAAHAAEERLVTMLSQFRRPVPLGPPYPVPR